MTFDLQLAAAAGHLEHQEVSGIEMGFDAMLQDPDVHDCFIIIRNDCAPALSCLERGSSRSPRLQSISENQHRGGHPQMSPVGLPACFWRAVNSGRDYSGRDGSRKHAWHSWDRHAAQHSNKSYWISLRNTVLLVQSWSTFSPHGAGIMNLRVRGGTEKLVFILVPRAQGLENRIVRRAKSDRARGIFLVPRKQPLLSSGPRQSTFPLCRTGATSSQEP